MTLAHPFKASFIYSPHVIFVKKHNELTACSDSSAYSPQALNVLGESKLGLSSDTKDESHNCIDHYSTLRICQIPHRVKALQF